MAKTYMVQMLKDGVWVCGAMPYFGNIPNTNDFETAQNMIDIAKYALEHSYISKKYHPTEWRILSCIQEWKPEAHYRND